jgi:poly(A) polymerase
LEALIKKIQKLSKGYEVYFVGGFVRDLLTKRPHTDIDLSVAKHALKYSKMLAKAFGVKVIVIDAEHGTYRLYLANSTVRQIDISLLDGDNILEDLKKRDFTVNAFAIDINRLAVLSNLIYADKKALKDLRAKVLKPVSKESFKQDPLRMLRAFRFCAELGWTISPQTLKQIKKSAPLIKNCAGERIKAELFRVLDAPFCALLIKLMDKTGILGAILPETIKMKKAAKKFYYHKGGLFEHSFESFEAVESILSNLKKYFPQNLDDLKKHFEDNLRFSEFVTRAGLLKLAALFHDNAKPETAKRVSGKIRFLKHDELGAAKVEKIFEKLKLGTKDVDLIKKLISNHMRPSNLSKSRMITKRAKMKFFREIGDETPEQIILSMADWHSYRGLNTHSPQTLKNQEKEVKVMMASYYEIKNQKPLIKLIDGHIIMKKFKLKPGPWIGDLLKLVVEKQKQGKIKDEKGALKLVDLKLTPILKKYNIASL